MLYVSDWKYVVRQQFIYHDLDAHPFQIKTNSPAGSGDVLDLIMYTKDNNKITDNADLGYFVIRFEDPLEYWVKHCTGPTTQTTITADQDKVWTVTKTPTNLIVNCNGAKFFDLEFTLGGATCASKWSQDVAKIAFWADGGVDDDTASDQYRKIPTCSSLPDGARLEIDTDVLPVNQGTTIRVKCSAGFMLVGDGVITCSQENYFSGSTSCLKCEAGKFSVAGSEACSDCEAGKFSAAGSATCSDCEAGTFSAAGSSKCLGESIIVVLIGN